MSRDSDDRGYTVFFAASQVFRFTATSLKPSTRHLFYFDNTDKSASCKPIGGVLGGNILTDTSGNVVFDYYYNSGLTTSTDYAAAKALANSRAGDKVAKLASSDALSHAQCIVIFVGGGGSLPSGGNNGISGTGVSGVSSVSVSVAPSIGQGISGTGAGSGAGGASSGCFTGDTKVLIADGSSKKIKDVKIGDKVFNFNKTKVNTVKFVEYLVMEEELYSPDEGIPFATKDHPLYKDGKLHSVYPDYTYGKYPWLGKTELFTYMHMTSPINLEVYNLWVDGDGTYTVNGWGTTSIVGDGGGMRRAFEQKLVDHNEVIKMMRRYANSNKCIVYGAYLVNKIKWFAEADVTPINLAVGKVLVKIALSDNVLVKKLADAFYGTIGAVALLNNKIKQKM